MIEIRSVDHPVSIAAAQSLVRAHIAAHSAIHDADGVERVVRALPEPYVAPRGVLWVAWEKDEARGYSRLRLGTLPGMYAAQQLYASLGFRRVPAYRPVEFGETWFYERPLGTPVQTGK